MARLERDEYLELTALRKPAGRAGRDLLLIPGYKCVEEYLRAGGRPERLLTVAGEEAAVRSRLGEELWKRAVSKRPAADLREHELARLADQPSPEPVLAVGAAPPAATATGEPQLILDGVADPGNLGSILRTALWFGIDRVWLSEDAVDPWSPRAIRAATGHAFHMRLLRRASRAEIEALVAGGARLVGLDSGGGAALEDHAFEIRDVIVAGGESHGLSSCAGLLGLTLHIEGDPRAESLNVGHAFAIAAWRRARSLRDTP